MIRKKQIEKAAFDYINSDVVSPMNMQLAFGDFINGVKWADRTMIEKACEYLKNALYEVASGVTNSFDIMSIENTTMDDFISSFRKAMEE